VVQEEIWSGFGGVRRPRTWNRRRRRDGVPRLVPASRRAAGRRRAGRSPGRAVLVNQLEPQLSNPPDGCTPAAVRRALGPGRHGYNGRLATSGRRTAGSAVDRRGQHWPPVRRRSREADVLGATFDVTGDAQRRTISSAPGCRGRDPQTVGGRSPTRESGCGCRGARAGPGSTRGRVMGIRSCPPQWLAARGRDFRRDRAPPASRARSCATARFARLGRSCRGDPAARSGCSPGPDRGEPEDSRRRV
jgi:hypothetical protein